MEIAWECNVDCASQRMMVVQEQIDICLKGKGREFPALFIARDCTKYMAEVVCMPFRLSICHTTIIFYNNDSNNSANELGIIPRAIHKT
jgi:hypothetical protein